MTTFIDNNSINDDIKNDNDEKQLELLSFPIGILSIILVQFLTIKDVGLLDTSYCNKKKRTNLLNILANDKYIVYSHFHYDYLKKCTSNFMIWVGSRHLTIMELLQKQSYKELGSSFPFILDEGILGLSRHCSNLKSLIMSACRNITDTSITELARHCSNLESLNIGGCLNITDTSITELKRHYSKLDIYRLISNHI